ncbi:hypothetical protein NC981_00935 [Leptolyngbya sp. DQ-M1]|uniref:hypothetical protein n=1 Tax=Leptolyngbya sp. DQ-M1 TaxID=2933920 RepID=UPI003296A71E
MNIIQTTLAGLMVGSLAACQLAKTQLSSPTRTMSIQIYQKWELQRGNRINNQTIVSALGELAIDLDGKPIYVPMSGEAKPDQAGCVLFAGTELPAYLFRFCGISSPTLGVLRKGQPIGTAHLLVFSTFLKQNNGTWAFVEPSKTMLEQILKGS